jgi:hypothetical protein
MTDEKKKTGPEPDTLKIEGDWETAIKKALDKRRPPEGWPKPPKPKRKPKTK